MEKQNTKLHTAFKGFRKAGLLARMNFMCCQTCAGNQMAVDVTRYIKEGKRTVESITGCVFFHNQDNDARLKTGEFYLAYGQIHTEEYGTIGLPDVEIGSIVTRILNESEIHSEWDETVGKRILVNLKKESLSIVVDPIEPIKEEPVPNTEKTILVEGTIQKLLSCDITREAVIDALKSGAKGNKEVLEHYGLESNKNTQNKVYRICKVLEKQGVVVSEKTKWSLK